jgi:hypothetical protein
MTNNDSNKLELKAEKIQNIYRGYLSDLKILEKRQSEVINNFVKTIEANKIKDIKKFINN